MTLHPSFAKPLCAFVILLIASAQSHSVANQDSSLNYSGAVGHELGIAWPENRTGPVDQSDLHASEIDWNQVHINEHPTDLIVAQAELEAYKESIPLYDEAIRNNPNDAESYFQRGYAKAQLELFDEALHDFDQAIRLVPGVSDSHFHRGFVKTQLFMLDDAIMDFNQAIELQPNSALPYYF